MAANPLFRFFCVLKLIELQLSEWINMLSNIFREIEKISLKIFHWVSVKMRGVSARLKKELKKKYLQTGL